MTSCLLIKHSQPQGAEKMGWAEIRTHQAGLRHSARGLVNPPKKSPVRVEK
jgi:hypothetical protein